jgi:hypothetical protein
MHTIQRGPFLFQDGICRLLPITRQAFPSLLVGRLASLQQVVVEPTALIKRLAELTSLFLGGVDAILKHLSHTVQFNRVVCIRQVLTKNGECVIHSLAFMQGASGTFW